MDTKTRKCVLTANERGVHPWFLQLTLLGLTVSAFPFFKIAVLLRGCRGRFGGEGRRGTGIFFRRAVSRRRAARVVGRRDRHRSRGGGLRREGWGLGF